MNIPDRYHLTLTGDKGYTWSGDFYDMEDVIVTLRRYRASFPSGVTVKEIVIEPLWLEEVES